MKKKLEKLVNLLLHYFEVLALILYFVKFFLVFSIKQIK